MRDVAQTVISQYGNSPTIRQLIDNFNTYIDQYPNFVGNPETLTGFYNYVWNLETAQGFGLDIWGRIIGVTRQLTITQPLEYFGFEEGADYQPFGQAPFYNGASSSDTYTLSDDAFRVLLFVKALANITDTTSPNLNKLLQQLFSGRGRCYVNDLGNMQMRYTFEFSLLPYEVAILTAGNVLPHPSGVQAFVLTVVPATTFGFAEAGGQPFNQGVFLSSGAQYAT